jgi:hypothetical protein
MAEMVESEVISQEEATIVEPSLPAIEEDAVPKVEEAAPKRKGRPVGAKSKVPGKPRAKRKVAIATEPVEAVTDTIRIEDDTLPRAIPHSQPIPRFSHDERSALMLQLLTQQAAQRKRQKVDLWRSWFK